MFLSIPTHDALSATSSGFFHVSIGTLYSVAMEPDLVQRNLSLILGKALCPHTSPAEIPIFPHIYWNLNFGFPVLVFGLSR